MKIYGHFLSPPANQVRLTASALGLDHEYISIDLTRGEHKKDAYLAVTSFGRVPAMDDNGYKLAESGAICRYLACRAGSGLYPDDVKIRGQIDQWMDFAAHHIRTNMSKILFNKIFAPMIGLPVDEKSMADGEKFLTANLPSVDAALAGRGFIVGDALSLADIALIAAMEPFEMIGYDMSKFENIVAWRNRLTGEAFYTHVHERYGAEMAG